MGLTRLRAEQISDIDYKQAVRVITVTNVTLSGGAPTPVDGVNLSAGDRVLVTGQSTGSQNGLYQVQTVGSGSNGTWVRTSDGNTTGEIEAGMIVMVTEGTIYADTQWKLITDNPIVIGTTALTFTQNYMANSISGGTSNVVVNSNANVTVSSAGTANVLTISNTGAFVSGVVSATGNVTGNYILGNGSLLTGVVTSLANINNGTSNVTVVSSGGNVTVGIGGTSNVAVFSTSGLDVTGKISATGNVTGGNVLTAGLVSATGNVTGGNLIAGTGASGNITGANVITANTVTATANITGGNILTTGLISATGTITSAANVVGGNISTAGLITATGNLQGGNIRTAGLVTATGNVTGGNITTAGLISATGNISGNFFLGNGSLLTGISAGSIANGTSNVTVVSSGGNVTVGIGGFSNVAIFGINTLSLSGPFATPKTINTNVSVSGSVNAVLVSPVIVDSLGNIFVPDSSTLTIFTPT
jgi:hypothetical protein